MFTHNIINSNGDLVATSESNGVDYKYNAYGTKISEPTTVTNPIGYRNYYYDTETGLYYLKARYYDSTTGQFTQEDTVQDDNLQYNLYGYCSANPILYMDSSGHIKVIEPLTKSVIDSAAKKYLLGKKYDLAYDMFHHALYGNGKKLSNSVLNKLKKKIKESAEIKKLMTDKLKPLKKKNHNYVRFMSATIEFKKGDLYYSVQHADCVYSGTYSNGKWTLKIEVFDKYDFDNFRTFKNGISVGNAANDMGVVLQKAKMLKPYRWGVLFDYKLSM